jgi:hypothetical protein
MAGCLFSYPPTRTPLGVLEAIKDTGPDDCSRGLGMLQ